MAKKSAVSFLCAECGEDFPKWSGRCPACGAWNSLAEFKKPTPMPGAAAAPTGIAPTVKNFSEIDADLDAPRRRTGLGEVDRALGGGLLPGQVCLLSGEPGVGKSTVLLEICRNLAAEKKSPPPLVGGGRGEGEISQENFSKKSANKIPLTQTASGALDSPTRGEWGFENPQTPAKVLYLSGEESLAQIALRARRLGADGEKNLRVAAETSLENALAAIASERPDFVVVDSIQTLFSSGIDGVAGGPAQLRFSTLALIDAAKKIGFSLVLVGQVTKDGTVAGPQTIAHAVDTVLSLEGDRTGSFRLLRALKNRFGPTDEVGVLEMTEAGLRSVENPSKMLLDGRADAAPGSVVTALVEGTRPLLAEIQALTVKGAFSAPIRRVSGLPGDRVPLLIAVLQKHGGLQLGDQDVFVNAVGGLGPRERAADLGIVLAIASSFLGKNLPPDLLVFGEVGLSGEVRAVPMTDARVREAQKLGFKKILCPAGVKKAPGVFPIKNVAGAVERLRQL